MYLILVSSNRMHVSAEKWAREIPLKQLGNLFGTPSGASSEISYTEIFLSEGALSQDMDCDSQRSCANKLKKVSGSG